VNTHRLCRRFALLLSLTLILCVCVSGTTAYLYDRSNVVTNTFAFDPGIFPPPPVVTPEIEIDLPDTGDHSSLLLYGALLTMSVGALAIQKRRAEKA